jgi:hypothetical protein
MGYHLMQTVAIQFQYSYILVRSMNGNEGTLNERDVWVIA